MEHLPNRIRTPAHALRTFAWLLLAAIVMAAPAAAQPQLADSRPSKETLGAGDSIRITVFQNQDLTTETRLSPAGSIVFPLIGEVALDGLTPAQAGSRIADRLKRGRYIVNPQVAVAIVQVRSRQVHVLGQVLRPGTYVLEDTASRLTDILTLAGGISPAGADAVTILKRRGSNPGKYEINVPAIFNGGDPAANIEIESGDTLFVERAPVFYIYGEVQRAGAYRLEPHMIVMQALSLGGGLTARGTERGIGIHRREPGGQFRKLEARLTDTVQADDIVFVRESLF
jgi:polysaccharide biosynthesis/export protein